MASFSTSFRDNTQTHQQQRSNQMATTTNGSAVRSSIPGLSDPLDGNPVTSGSNHNNMGRHSAHVPGRRSTMQEQSNRKAASSRAILASGAPDEGSYLSPAPQKNMRHSLLGFDPLMPGGNANPPRNTNVPNGAPPSSSFQQSRRSSAPEYSKDLSTQAPKVSSFGSKTRKPPSTPQEPELSMKDIALDKSQSHHIQSFGISDFRYHGSGSDDQGNLSLEQRSNSSNSSSPIPEEEEDSLRQPATPLKTDRETYNFITPKTPRNENSKDVAPKAPKAPQADGAKPPLQTEKKNPSPKRDGVSKVMPRKNIFTKPDKRVAETQKETISNNEKTKNTCGHQATPQKGRKLPNLKKALKRRVSMSALDRFERNPVPQGPTPSDDNHRSSVPNTPVTERKSSMYPSIVADLMELRFDKLQLPSLAKPSPTSFLTGKEDEVVRTCELEAAPFQMEIPTLSETVLVARMCEFAENYRRVDQNFDLQQWVGLSRNELRQVRIPQHIPIAQSLLECGEDVSLQGFVTDGTNPDDRLEAAIFEGQREFICVFRGTTEQQSRPGNNIKNRKKAVPLDAEHENVEVYQCFIEEYMKLEKECFTLMDKLTEQHPFCDVVFSGHSFGAAMATIAALRYANARPMMRVSCIALASPKVGFSQFRHLVNSSPNLKVMRLEFGQDGKCQLPGVGGSHVGHTLVLHGSLGHNSLKTSQPVLAYKFATPKPKKFKTTHPDLSSYVTALEEVVRLRLPWAKEFVGISGEGVIVNNEARLVV